MGRVITLGLVKILSLVGCSYNSVVAINAFSQKEKSEEFTAKVQDVCAVCAYIFFHKKFLYPEKGEILKMNQMTQKRDTSRGFPGKSKPRHPGNDDKKSRNPINRFGSLKIDENKKECTHFISIPFNDDDFKKAFNVFRDDLKNNYGRYHVHEDIIQKTEKLHRTIINLRLPTQGDIDRAKKVFEGEKDAVEKIIKRNKQTKHVIIVGLQEPRNLMRAFALYANLRSQIIVEITNHLTEVFEKANIIICSDNPVSNRITVIQKSLLTPENTQRIDYSFNPGPILHKYKNYEFGKFNIKEINLSRRRKYGTDGYFESEAVMSF
ncbi:uncharacterized protein LOC129801290 [Phlebotomus papatasi]|uniref:uncharacterized protein LOC129801290 n=1 Tax=Phlebotomus papatasi TaxID=29031 RepID=UPI0024834F1E|nr:uncharacterized protein LOC129801290 [Phlebotomus papatasi]